MIRKYSETSSSAVAERPRDASCLSVISFNNNNNNNNNNKHDNVYGAVIMAEPLREFTRFIWWM